MIHKLKKLSEIWQYTAPLKKRLFLKLGNTFLKTRKKIRDCSVPKNSSAKFHDRVIKSLDGEWFFFTYINIRNTNLQYHYLWFTLLA